MAKKVSPAKAAKKAPAKKEVVKNPASQVAKVITNDSKKVLAEETKKTTSKGFTKETLGKELSECFTNDDHLSLKDRLLAEIQKQDNNLPYVKTAVETLKRMNNKISAIDNFSLLSTGATLYSFFIND